jgi:hypothetical protein
MKPHKLSIKHFSVHGYTEYQQERVDGIVTNTFLKVAKLWKDHNSPKGNYLHAGHLCILIALARKIKLEYRKDLTFSIDTVSRYIEDKLGFKEHSFNLNKYLNTLVEVGLLDKFKNRQGIILYRYKDCF